MLLLKDNIKIFMCFTNSLQVTQCGTHVHEYLNFDSLDETFLVIGIASIPYYLNVPSCNVSISSEIDILVGTTPAISMIE